MSSIQSELNQASWHHVKLRENPADRNFRGLTRSEFDQSELWWCGPSWINEESLHESASFEIDEEVRLSVYHAVTAQLV